MGKSSPAPPPAPDYAGLAAQQGAANVEAARASAKLSNPNIRGPLGGQTVTYGNFDQAGYDKAMADWQAAGGTQATYDEFGNLTGGGAMPTKAQFMSDVDTPTITQYLTPEAQATLEAQQRVQKALAGLGEQGISTASKIMGTPFQYQGPAIQTSLGGYGQVQNAPNLEGYGRAGANVAAQGVNYGPYEGQYGMAQAGPSGGAYGYAQGGPAAGQFGMQQGGVAGPQLQSGLEGVANVNYGPTSAERQQGYVPGPDIQTSLDTSKLAAAPVAAGTTAQQAIMSRLQPQLERQRSQLETQLANQGLVRGGEAYNTALQEQGQRENDLLSQAALQGINLDMAARQQGLGEAQTLGNFANQAQLARFGAGVQGTQLGNQAAQQNFANQQAIQAAQNAAQQQAFNQRLQAGEFGNQAQLASFGANLQNQQAQNQAAAANFAQAQAAAQMGNQAAAQNFAQGQAATQMYNQAVQQNMAMGMSAAQAQNAAAQQLYNQQMGIQGLYNAAVGQNQQTALAQQAAQNAAQNQAFNQALQGTQFGNTAAQQALQQQLGLYNQPLNQISALMSGSQIQMPQFQGYQGANVAAAPVFQAGQAQNAYNMDVYNAQQASANQGLGGLFGLGAAALGGPAGGVLGGYLKSDMRLKSNIVKIGQHPRGFGIYEYDIDGRRERGVMAQEVEKILPHAVAEHPDGYKMVNYGAL